MENLSLQDLPPAGGPNNVQPPPGPPGVPQLPPQVSSNVVLHETGCQCVLRLAQMFTTAAQLLDLTDSEAYLSPFHDKELKD